MAYGKSILLSGRNPGREARMAERVVIYGTDTCPYTSAAREDYGKKGYEVEYVNVKTSPERLPGMLELLSGRRVQPVIVIGSEITVGFGGT
jgi:glutaredoxin 3